MSDSEIVIIYIDGNIGSGKTTLIQNITDMYPNVYPIYENVSQWINSKLLEDYYSNPKKYAFEFQMEVIKSRVIQYNEVLSRIVTNKYNVVILLIERSFESNMYCFAKRLYKQGNISRKQWNMYMKEYNNILQILQQNYHTKATRIYYIRLNTNPGVCKSRIKQRNRSEENGITLSFLEEIDMYHKQLYDVLKTNNTVLILNDVCITDVVKCITKNMKVFTCG